jgi:hypothetical protein
MAMPSKQRAFECPQCGGRITAKELYRCRTCGYVLDMARISHEAALAHDRYEARRRKLEWLQAGLWLVVSVAVVAVVAVSPGPIIFAGGVAGVIVQVCWGRTILARLRKK